MNSKACRINFAFHTINVTRKFMNEASKPFTDEYRMLTNLMKDHPDYSVEIIRTQRSHVWMPTYALNFVSVDLGIVHRCGMSVLKWNEKLRYFCIAAIRKCEEWINDFVTVQEL